MNSIQVIKRRESNKKFVFVGEKAQISYNSDGRICIRLYEGYGDDLFVLDENVSNLLLDFIKKLKIL